MFCLLENNDLKTISDNQTERTVKRQMKLWNVKRKKPNVNFNFSVFSNNSKLLRKKSYQMPNLQFLFIFGDRLIKL